MSERSVYYGQSCLHCHKRIALRRACFVTTYFVTPGRSWVRTQAMKGKRDTLGLWEDHEDEMQLRIVYHRACIEGIMRRGPNDPAIEVAEFNEYRAALIERLDRAGQDL